MRAEFTENPIGRFIRLLFYDNKKWIGGFILRSPLPMIHCRDKHFGLDKYKPEGKIPHGESPYWEKLNKLVNMARAFIFEEYQNCGYGTIMMKLIQSQGRVIWKSKYGFEPLGIDCLDVAPPRNAKIFLRNDWKYIGRTKGHTHSRGCLTGKINDLKHAIEGRMKKQALLGMFMQ